LYLFIFQKNDSNTKNKLLNMEKTAISKNQAMINILFIVILICIYLFDQRTYFINGAIQGIKDFGILPQ